MSKISRKKGWRNCGQDYIALFYIRQEGILGTRIKKDGADPISRFAYTGSSKNIGSSSSSSYSSSVSGRSRIGTWRGS